jgi:hypothetical protein
VGFTGFLIMALELDGAAFPAIALAGPRCPAERVDRSDALEEPPRLFVGRFDDLERGQRRALPRAVVLVGDQPETGKCPDDGGGLRDILHGYVTARRS